MRPIFPIALLVLLFSTTVLAQDPSLMCPSVSVIAPTDTSDIGNLVFRSSLGKQMTIDNAAYVWFIKGGKIVSGQGTPNIVAAMDSVDTELTVTVAIGGIPQPCVYTASESVRSSSSQRMSTPCPSLSISGPSGTAMFDRIPFTLSIGREIDLYQVVYKWWASQGDIVVGSDNKSIEVLNVDFREKSLTVSIEISGLPKHCSNTFSETMSVSVHAPTIKLDEIKGSMATTPKARFDKIHSVVAIDPRASLYIIISAGKTKATSIQRKQAVIMKQFASPAYTSTFHDRRITFVHSTKNDDKVVFWLVPAGNDFPTP